MGDSAVLPELVKRLIWIYILDVALFFFSKL